MVQDTPNKKNRTANMPMYKNITQIIGNLSLIGLI